MTPAIRGIAASDRMLDALVSRPHRPLSVLFVIPDYPPVLGGAEMHASRLAAALRARGHTVDVLTTWAPVMPDASTWSDPQGVPVRAIGRSLPAAQRPRIFVLATAWRLLAYRGRYDVVHVFLTGLHVVSALVAGALVGVPGAVMFGGMHEVPRLRASRFGRLQLRAIRRFAQRVIVLNEPMRADVRALGVEDARIVTHPCSVDPETFQPLSAADVAALRTREGIPPAARLVAFTGRFVPGKGIETLIEAFCRVRRELPDALLVLGGDGPLRSSLEALAHRKLGAGTVQFRGKLEPAGVRQQLQCADAFSFVSRSEGIPCSVIEAMSCGLPCVVSDAPGVAQLIEHERDGLVVPAGDADATAAALVRVLSNPDMAKAFGAAARQRVLQSFSSPVVAANHERMYLEMLTTES